MIQWKKHSLSEYKFLFENYTSSYFAFFDKWRWNCSSNCIFLKKYVWLTHLTLEHVNAQEFIIIIISDNSQSLKLDQLHDRISKLWRCDEKQCVKLQSNHRGTE